jgi:uncharacterized protein YrrD
MLIKGNDVLNLRVLSTSEGKEVGKVKDIIYDPQDHTVQALLLDEGGWFSDAKIIPFDQISSIGDDAVMVPDERAVRKAKDVSARVSSIAKDKTYLTKTRIVTEDGTDLGRVSDVIFDDATGRVDQFEVTQGVKDVATGKKYVFVKDIITIGEDATIVRSYTEESFQEQAKRGGIQGAVNAGKEKMQVMAEDARQRAADLAQRAKEAPNDPQVQQQARDAQQKAQDFASQAKGRAQELGNKVQQKMQDVQHDPRTQEAVENVKEKAEHVKGVLIQALGSAKDKIEEARVRDAVGKFATKTVLLPDDQPLIEQGQMVTNEVIVRARENNVLDQVLAYTSNEQPQTRPS